MPNKHMYEEKGGQKKVMFLFWLSRENTKEKLLNLIYKETIKKKKDQPTSSNA